MNAAAPPIPRNRICSSGNKKSQKTNPSFLGWLPSGGWLGTETLFGQNQLSAPRHLKPILLPVVMDDDLPRPFEELLAPQHLAGGRRLRTLGAGLQGHPCPATMRNCPECSQHCPRGIERPCGHWVGCLRNLQIDSVTSA